MMNPSNPITVSPNRIAGSGRIRGTSRTQEDTGDTKDGPFKYRRSLEDTRGYQTTRDQDGFSRPVAFMAFACRL
jgi:hypothetical protein